MLDSAFGPKLSRATDMHPGLSRQLTLEQLDEAQRRDGLFDAVVRLEERSYPVFFVHFATVGGVDRVLRFEASNYDSEPLEVDPVDPKTRAPLELGAWMMRGGQAFPAHPLQGGRPFLCITGTRAYYTHPNHSPKTTGERWERHRRDLKIADILAFIRDRVTAGVWR